MHKLLYAKDTLLPSNQNSIANLYLIYPIRRRSYDRLHGKKYVTPCQPSTQTFAHQKTLVGYVHDDANKISKSTVEVSFKREGQKIVVVSSQVDKTVTPAPYARVGERAETKAYNTRMSDRCYQERRFRQKTVFRRVDGSTFEQDSQDKVDSVDLCVRTKEERYEPAHVSYLFGEVDDWYHLDKTNIPDGIEKFPWGLSMWLKQPYVSLLKPHNLVSSHGAMWQTDKIYERLKTVYPDKTVEYTTWGWTGFYRDYNLVPASYGFGRVDSPPKERVWYNTERKYYVGGDF